MGDEGKPTGEQAAGDAPECKTGCGRTSRSATNKSQNMTCAQILSKMKELMDSDKDGRAGPKGLIQRFRDFKGDDATHGGNIEDQQASLRSYMQSYKNKGCGDPPDGAQELADRPLPTSSPSQGSNAVKAVAAGGATVGAGYLAYRAVRMIPSLLPPLWETIPVNLAVP